MWSIFTFFLVGRFQLFGDSMNTTARIERCIYSGPCQVTLPTSSLFYSQTRLSFSNSSSTGEKNRIHISQETSDLLAQAGKQHWVVMRKDKVVAKGKVDILEFIFEKLDCIHGIFISNPLNSFQ